MTPPLRPDSPEFASLRPFDQLVEIMAALRVGCPWDREQTHESLIRYLEEEAYEAVEAIEALDYPRMCEELGDVLLQIVFHAKLAQETGHFVADDVCRGIVDKMVRRHPHVFGDRTGLETSGQVLQQWEQIKLEEKGARRKSLLDGIPPRLPALSTAERLQGRAAEVGFDWPDAASAAAKVSEELAEFLEAPGVEQAEEELGDLLFAVVSLARQRKLNPEAALRRASRKFTRRFQVMEEQLTDRPLSSLSGPELLQEFRKAAERERERQE